MEIIVFERKEYGKNFWVKRMNFGHFQSVVTSNSWCASFSSGYGWKDLWMIFITPLSLYNFDIIE